MSLEILSQHKLKIKAKAAEINIKLKTHRIIMKNLEKGLTPTVN